MKTVRLQVTEKLEIERVLEFEVSDDVEDAEIEMAVDYAESKAEFVEELPYFLRKYGLAIEVTSDISTDYSSPDSVEIEIDYLDIEGEE